MYKQSEGFSQRRHISPDSYGKLDKLNLIQENLSLAATTIQALKQERDKLKESLIRGHPKTSKKEDSQNTHSEDIKKRALKDELFNLQRIAIEKDRIIDNMEAKIQESRIEKTELKALKENYSALSHDLIEKEKYIISLEKRLNDNKLKINERKLLNDENFELKQEILHKMNIIEAQAGQIKDLMNEKAQWKKLKDLLQGLSEEFSNEIESFGVKSDWQRFNELILGLRSKNIDKEKTIETLTKQIKQFQESEERTEWVQLQEANKLLKQELNASNYRKPLDSYGLFTELKDLACVLIEKMRSDSFLYTCFKSRMVCSKRFKNMIENQEFPESLLRMMKLLLDVTEDYKVNLGLMKTDNESKPTRCPTEYLNTISSWTQTVESSFNRTKPHSDNENSKSTKEFHTYIEPIPKQSFTSISPKFHKSIQVSESARLIQPQPVPKPNLQNSSKNTPTKAESKKFVFKNNLETQQNVKNSHQTSDFQNLPRKNEEYMKLADESQMLLNIIDKQNSRLSKINNQILSLVPNHKEEMNFVETEEKSIDKDEDSEDSKEFSVNETSSNTRRKRSGWDLSVLRIPRKDSPETRIPTIGIRRGSPKKEVAFDEKKIRNRSKSPDSSMSRFEEYNRPILKKENCWGSVADFFSNPTSNVETE